MVDTIKAVFTYLIALVTIVGGGLFLYATRLETADSLQILVGGFMGSALTFVFSSEVQTRTARQAAASTAAATPLSPTLDAER